MTSQSATSAVQPQAGGKAAVGCSGCPHADRGGDADRDVREVRCKGAAHC